METEFFLSQIDRTGLQQSQQSLYSSLSAYIRSHDMPIKLFSRKGELFLMRLDIDENKEPIENWRQVRDIDTDMDPVAITPDEVADRFAEEKGQTNK